MIGMNLLFHVAAVVGTVGLVWFLLRTQKDRDLLRSIVRQGSQADGIGQKPVLLASPGRYLRQWSRAVGVPLEGAELLLDQPRRIDGGPLVDLLLRRGVAMIRCKQSPDGPKIEFVLEKDGAGPEPEALAKALGGGTPVELTSRSQG